MINSAYEYKLPHRLGILRVKKFKGLKRQVDWGLTNKHYKEENATKPSGSKSFIYHNNKLINRFIGKIFKKLEPELNWQQRHPFK